MYRGKVRTITSNDENIASEVKKCDILIGAVLVTGARAPGLVSADLVSKMKKGSVIIDISIDRGGSIETSELRTQVDPVFVKHGVIHYCVPNIASRVARTASIAISNVFAPLILGFGQLGTTGRHLKENVGLRNGVYIYNGILTNETIGQKLGISSKDIDLLMAAF